MFSINGQIINAFTVPKSEKYDESFKVQLLGDQITNAGQLRKEMVTLSVPRDVFNDLQSQVGHEVTLPVGIFARNGQLNVFFNQKEKAA